MIPYGRQWIDDADIQAVIDTLRSDWLTQGPAVGKLEAALAELCRAPHLQGDEVPVLLLDRV